ncbi:hypothetical protein BH11MYX1_BH11MYX1_09110 [soil metagenome]
MKTFAVRIVLLVAALTVGCGKQAKDAGGGSGVAAGGATGSGDLYFNVTVDGKPLSIAAADITTTFRRSNAQLPVLSIYAGKTGAPQILLTIPQELTGPSSTPNGAPEPESGIVQGSVSLQDYPEKGYTTNSFNTPYPETMIVVPDAVVITAVTPETATTKLITGTISVKTFAGPGHTDPKDADHVLKGKFRIRHEFTSTSGEKF